MNTESLRSLYQGEQMFGVPIEPYPWWRSILMRRLSPAAPDRAGKVVSTYRFTTPGGDQSSPCSGYHLDYAGTEAQ